MKFTHFFWDFDGTLFDTYPRINRAIQKALKDEGYDLSIDAIVPLTKVSLGHLAHVVAPEKERELMQRYHEHAEEEGEDTIQPYAGAKRLLQSICAHGGHNYLYTIRGLTAIDALKRCGLHQYFTDCVTKADGFPSKPAPDALLYLMEKHGLSPEQCVMIGDRDIDLNSGLNAGMSCALFDPGHFYDAFDTPYRYTSLFELMCDLVWDGAADDLCMSDMLSLQKSLQALHPAWGAVNNPQKALTWLLWMVGEVGEVIDVAKKNSGEHLMQPGFARERLVEELTDVAMYFNDVLNCYNISTEEFSAAYYGKMQRNLRRDYTAEHEQRYGK